ncbi:MAG: PEP-CTERM sorting domain-containing protein, partial [Pirellulales bacterium]|nr:PEP-CTERM sorting domain-containing protein [Pirellulales bacterium]
SFDAASLAPAGFTAEWVVDSSTVKGRRTELLLQQSQAFRGGNTEFGLQFRHNGTLQLRTFNNVPEVTIGSFTASSLTDGFTVLGTFNSTGWTWDFTGVTGLTSISGNWGDSGSPVSYAAAFSSTQYVAGMIQRDANGGSEVLNIDAIEIVAFVPEPSALVLAALGLMGLVGTRRRRRR